MMKKLVLSLFILSSLTVVTVGTFSVLKVEQLRKGYVQTSFSKEEGVDYRLSTKKPKSWAKLSKLDETVYSAIVISEDWAFFEHGGIDFNQLQIALIEMYEGKRVRGASTISQQLAKNLFTDGDRSYLRKIKELIATVILERALSKERILELYLNVIEYGEGIYGIEAAAKHYFKKSASELNTKEGAFLAMLLPNPKRYSQSFRERKLTEYAEETINKILDKMAVAKYISKEEALFLKSQPLSFEKKNIIDDVFEYFNSI
ncbi:monofunctional biosynthetic peptidoglycan transglycosylase [Bacteriovorax sp. DB6_IX]|nr:monofunctional biosynthetic peptidoglycan transglycosylase [Bacteriovorax sp. DB6_IX]